MDYFNILGITKYGKFLLVNITECDKLLVMDILKFVKEKVTECNLAELEKVSSDTGIPYPTLMKIKYGETINPRIKTIQPLLTYFQKAA